MSKLVRAIAVILLILGTLSASVLAQGNRNPKRPRGASAEPMEPVIEGAGITTIDLMFVPKSLNELAEASDLIVEGEVESVLESRYSNSDIPVDLDTDLKISVKRVLKGAKDIKSVVVSQPGGKLNGLETKVREDPLMQEGEHYILFLIEDARVNLPGYKDPRYIITALWHGRFKIEDSKIKPNPTATLKAYEGRTVDSFVSDILKATSNTPAGIASSKNRRRVR
ncbi:MAG: hypothetical protein HYR55_18270 [Acidobacteria bacterium]|nr:hypothetical protein [Acidobacteriota bacterium]MBI3657377.1 hypothetical protein [Acidobacteriota bacterium]